MTAGARRPFTTRHLGGLLVTGLALTVAVAALLGYVFGALTSGVSLHTATVGSEARGIFVHEDGLTYNIPLDVAWTDAQGGFHEGGRPDCLAPTGNAGPVTFGSVDVRENGASWRQVVWVSCQP